MRYHIAYRGGGRRFDLTGQLHCGRLRRDSSLIHAAITLDTGREILLEPHAVVTDDVGNVVFMGCSAEDRDRDLRRRIGAIVWP